MQAIKGREMKEFIFHTGVYKAGSSFLQRNFFPFLDDIYDVRSKNPTFYSKLFDKFVAEMDCQIDSRICPEEIFKQIKERKILFSFEALFGGIDLNNKNNFYLTNVIKNYFPEAKIIVIIRKQDNLIESLYKQSLQNYRSLSLEEFLDEKKGLVSAFHWCSYINNYIKQFGEKNVLVLPYEQMKTNKRLFFDNICHFIGRAPYYPNATKFENRSYSRLSCHIALALNRFVANKKLFNSPFFEYLLLRKEKNYIFRILLSISYRWNLRWFLQKVVDRIFYIEKAFIDKSKRKEIMDIYRQSNKILDNELNLNLGQYNYF